MFANTMADEAPRRRKRRRGGLAPAALVSIPVLFILVAFLYPVGQIIVQSFTEPSLGVEQYEKIFGTDSSREILWRTLKVAAITSLVALALGYPYAYALRMAGPRMRIALVCLVLTPFWISLIARTFAWVVLFRQNGPVQAFTEAVGLGSQPLLSTQAGVIIAMVQVLLPFMILPLYNAMSDIDLGLANAAASLGANKRTQFITVFLPLSARGMVAGTTLVFILCLGFYLTPELVGSAQEPVVGQLIALRVKTMLDFAYAGALATILLVITGIVLFVTSRLGASGSAIAAGAKALKGGSR